MLRVVNDAPQVQVTWVSTYSGWVSFFMVFLSNCSGSPAWMRSDVNRSRRTSVPPV